MSFLDIIKRSVPAGTFEKKEEESSSFEGARTTKKAETEKALREATSPVSKKIGITKSEPKVPTSKVNMTAQFVAPSSYKQRQQEQLEAEIEEKGAEQVEKEIQERKDSLVYKQTVDNAMGAIKRANAREKWVKERMQLPGVKDMSYSELKNLAPEKVVAKEIEYKKAQEKSEFIGAVLQGFDEDLVRVYGEERLAEIETSAAFAPDKAMKNILTAMTLDTVDFNDIANLGQDVYMKDGKMYYQGMEVGEEYLTEAGKKADKGAAIAAQFMGALAPYGLISKGIKVGVGALKGAATAKGMKTTAKVFGTLDKMAKTEKLWKSVLAEATAFNVMEETVELGARKATGQEYTFNDFMNGLLWGAGLGSTLQIAGKMIPAKALKSQLTEANKTFEQTKDFESIKDMPLGDSTFGKTFEEQRFAYLKQPADADARPGIEKPAALPETALTTEAKKYKSAEEFVEGFNKKTEEINLAFEDTSKKISSEVQKLNDSFMQYVDNAEIQKMYEARKTDTDILTDIWNKAQVPEGIVPEKGTVRVAQSIESKAVEQRLAENLGDIAEYDKITIKDQAEKSTKLIETDIDRAKSIIKGDEMLPSDMRGAAFITAAENYAIKNKDGEMLAEIAKSPLTAETSVHAQEMRLLAERDPDSAVMAMRDIKKAREIAAQKKTKTKSIKQAKDKIVKEIKKDIKKVQPTKDEWGDFIDTITC